MCIYIYIYTHTHTHIYIYIYIRLYVSEQEKSIATGKVVAIYFVERNSHPWSRFATL